MSQQPPRRIPVAEWQTSMPAGTTTHALIEMFLQSERNLYPRARTLIEEGFVGSTGEVFRYGVVHGSELTERWRTPEGVIDVARGLGYREMPFEAAALFPLKYSKDMLEYPSLVFFHPIVWVRDGHQVRPRRLYVTRNFIDALRTDSKRPFYSDRTFVFQAPP